MNRRQTLKGLLLVPLGLLFTPKSENQLTASNSAFRRELEQLCKKHGKEKGVYVEATDNWFGQHVHCPFGKKGDRYFWSVFHNDILDENIVTLFVQTTDRKTGKKSGKHKYITIGPA
jgi:hypothetical protein